MWIKCTAAKPGPNKFGTAGKFARRFPSDDVSDASDNRGHTRQTIIKTSSIDKYTKLGENRERNAGSRAPPISKFPRQREHDSHAASAIRVERLTQAQRQPAQHRFQSQKKADHKSRDLQHQESGFIFHDRKKHHMHHLDSERRSMPSKSTLSSTVASASSYLSSYLYQSTHNNRREASPVTLHRHPAFHNPQRHKQNSKQKESGALVNYNNGISSVSGQHFNISTVTWNLAEQKLTLKDCNFLKHFSHDDFVVLGIQEIENIKPRRAEGRRSRSWRSLRSKMLGKTHTCLIEHKFGGMQLAIHCHKRVRDVVAGVQVIEIPCGVGNVLSNKGGIALLLRLKGDRTLVFVNCHLAAHDKKVKQRNKDYHRIANTIVAEANSDWLVNGSSRGSDKKEITNTHNKRLKLIRSRHSATQPRHKSPRGRSGTIIRSSKPRSSKPLNQSFDAVVFMGDFNYRVDVTRLEINRLQDKFNKLLAWKKKMIQPPPIIVAKNASRKQEKHIPYDMRYQTSQSSIVDRSSNMDNDKNGSRNSGIHTSMITNSTLFKAFRDQLECVLDLDQLTTERLAGRVLIGFLEGEIDFPPTYKYDKRSSQFDSSSKARCPAWTDRILYTLSEKMLAGTFDGRKNISLPTETAADVNGTATTTIVIGEKRQEPLLMLKNYYSVDVRPSDHRPVCAQFDLSL